MSSAHWMASSPPQDTVQEKDSENMPKSSLRLSSLPPIFISESHFKDINELHRLEDDVVETGGLLSYNLHEAKIVLTRVLSKKRITMDLRSKDCYTEEVLVVKDVSVADTGTDPAAGHKAKRGKLSGEHEDGKKETEESILHEVSTDSETEDEHKPRIKSAKRKRVGSPVEQDPNEAYFSNPYVKVLKWEWFTDSQKESRLLPIEPYLLYQGRIIDKPDDYKTPGKGSSFTARTKTPQSILERARADAENDTSSPVQQRSNRKLGQIGGGRVSAPFQTTPHSKRAALLHQTTSEHDLGQSSDLPEMPPWVQNDVKYACQRSTPADPPNAAFIAQLDKIKLARLLTGDEIGVRAYSTSIAALAAYPHKLSTGREILLLPGCDAKIANLYVEFANYGKIQEAEDAENNEELKVQKLFYNIWGVGATTARDFYKEKGWRDLDDVVEYGWQTLTRVQQIGVKYYDEFLLPIPRSEVEDIAATIHKHAVKLRDAGIQSLVVGGYRRGKEHCGDVDIILSHPDESKTLNIITDIVASLEQESWITHTLLISTKTSDRGQQTLALNSSSTHGHGFDSLDKALVVWQNPHYTPSTSNPSNPKTKNTNPHRRVDIIISPWKTVGCAVMGWSGGTTFQRDLRRYVRQTYDYKFDSSGVRDRKTGDVVDVDGEAGTMEQAERNVFGALGLEFREPWERCTG
ncbi:Nucleotidyltransferase [Aureobasidium pullulans]|uniref:DNA polymerase n=1 Tax=Aureobasidium pullulans TaxID=5580 RepID=A0AB74JW84_AURPU|nr:Nucleotidyltransferase [Aureobasidium pullulans]THX40875.1 Nucleotidyltransferase [Aureobasidium pullulans]TIA49316.1 Nucleotidyltransferase [Aureobasidium pullulans]